MWKNKSETISRAGTRFNKVKSRITIDKILYLLYNKLSKKESGFMIAVNYSSARNNFKDYCDKATDDFETIIITRKENKNVDC